MKTDIREQETLYHPIMMDLLEWLEDATGIEFTQTSTYREGDPGVHGTILLRGVDLRCHVGTIGVQLELLVNNNWQYDPERPQKSCAIYHDVGQGRHLHVQVHDDTTRRK